MRLIPDSILLHQLNPYKPPIKRQSPNRAMTCAQVAAVLGLTREGVHAIEQRALRKLASRLRGEVPETRAEKASRTMKAYWARRRAS